MRTNPPSAAPSTPPSSPIPEELHDIIAPRHVATVWEWIALAAGLLIAAGLITALVLWWRRRRLLLSQPPLPPPPLPPHTRAWRELEAALRLIGDPDAFCTAVSGILRVYLEERFGWNAPDRTTEEFLADLGRQDDLSEALRPRLEDFLTRCDMVKFARFEPTESELRELHQSAVRLVSDTVPPPPPPGSNPHPSGPAGSRGIEGSSRT